MEAARRNGSGGNLLQKIRNYDNLGPMSYPHARSWAARATGTFATTKAE
jgi:hypothetical protein